MVCRHRLRIPETSLSAYPCVANLWELTQSQHEVHAAPGRQLPQPPLDQHFVDELERQVLGQLTEMLEGEDIVRDGVFVGDCHRGGKLAGQRDLSRDREILVGLPLLSEVPFLHPELRCFADDLPARARA